MKELKECPRCGLEFQNKEFYPQKARQKKIGNMLLQEEKNVSDTRSKKSRWITPEGNFVVFATNEELGIMGAVDIVSPLDIDFTVDPLVHIVDVYKVLGQLLELAYPETVYRHKRYRIQIKELT